MGSEATCARPEEHHCWEEVVVRYLLYFEGGIRAWEGREERCGEGVRVLSIGRTDIRLSGSDRLWYKGRPGPVERSSEVTCRSRG